MNLPNYHINSVSRNSYIRIVSLHQVSTPAKVNSTAGIMHTEFFSPDITPFAHLCCITVSCFKASVLEKIDVQCNPCTASMHSLTN